MKYPVYIFAILFALLMTSCSDNDLERLVEESVQARTDSLSAQTRAAKDATTLIATLATGGEGWSEEDSIGVYHFASMLHNSYHLSSGAGTTTATFNRTGGSDDYQTSDRLYALTNTRLLYSFSPDYSNRALVAIDVPSRFSLSDVAAPAGMSRTPIPCWAEVDFGVNGCLTGTFHSLTALLRLDAMQLPEGTRAVVLTTHYYGSVGSDELAEGEGESLSGTFDAVLTGGAALAPNEIFVSRDTLRVNLGTAPLTAAQRYLYIPVIATSYICLHLIAVTGDYRYPYTWDGTLLKTFNAATFKTNTITDVEWIDTGINLPRI